MNPPGQLRAQRYAIDTVKCVAIFIIRCFIPVHLPGISQNLSGDLTFLCLFHFAVLILSVAVIMAGYVPFLPAGAVPLVPVHLHPYGLYLLSQR